MGSYNARLYFPIGYSRRPLWGNRSAHQAATDTPSQRETRNTETREGIRFLGVGGNRMPGENLPRRVWNRQTKFTYNHWLAALVKGKCTSTKPTRLATGVVCHPDTEQNRPYKIPWSCRGLNRGPTAPQARTLPVCHTTP